MSWITLCILLRNQPVKLCNLHDWHDYRLDDEYLLPSQGEEGSGRSATVGFVTRELNYCTAQFDNKMLTSAKLM